ncbi:hypothetical protein AB0958_43680 [Streptomyces sp. NPDC006655]
MSEQPLRLGEVGGGRDGQGDHAETRPTTVSHDASTRNHYT